MFANGGSGPSSTILCLPILPQRGISVGSSRSVDVFAVVVHGQDESTCCSAKLAQDVHHALPLRRVVLALELSSRDKRVDDMSERGSLKSASSRAAITLALSMSTLGPSSAGSGGLLSTHANGSFADLPHLPLTSAASRMGIVLAPRQPRT